MSEREILETDVLIVGAGPSGLATALRLSQLYQEHNLQIERGERQGEKLSAEGICLLEKGKEVGSHLMSGAVMDPRGIRELLPELAGSALAEAIPGSCPVKEDAVFFLTEQGKWKLPVLPPFFHNDGNLIISLNRFGRWLGQRVEKAGVTVFSGFAGCSLLYDGERVSGVRTDDKGVDREGRHKSNFEPGIDVKARITVLAEGSRGSLAKQLLSRAAEIPGSQAPVNPQVYAVGVKELWEIPSGRIAPGTVMHSAGWPLDLDQFGGGWLYALPNGLVSIGLVSGLDYRDPAFDPHAAFQRYKTHPLFRSILEGGKLIKYGAKSIPEGGWYSLPPLVADGALLVGDTAGFVNSQRLKGIHLAIKSGILAAEAIYKAVTQEGDSSTALRSYPESVRNSWIYDELWPVRNFHQAMQGGIIRGGIQVAVQLVTGGRGLRERKDVQPGHSHLEKISGSASRAGAKIIPDGKLTFDKATDVFHSATRHEENQPCHLQITDPAICNTKCTAEYGNPCQHFCPAAVYEMHDSKAGRELHLNPSNCVHCKTCDIMDPYQIINWVPPEGGGGPSYENL